MHRRDRTTFSGDTSNGAMDFYNSDEESEDAKAEDLKLTFHNMAQSQSNFTQSKIRNVKDLN